MEKTINKNEKNLRDLKKHDSKFFFIVNESMNKSEFLKYKKKLKIWEESSSKTLW